MLAKMSVIANQMAKLCKPLLTQINKGLGLFERERERERVKPFFSRENIPKIVVNVS